VRLNEGTPSLHQASDFLQENGATDWRQAIQPSDEI
jgi:hypothetical protein